MVKVQYHNGYIEKYANPAVAAVALAAEGYYLAKIAHGVAAGRTFVWRSEADANRWGARHTLGEVYEEQPQTTRSRGHAS